MKTKVKLEGMAKIMLKDVDEKKEKKRKIDD